MTKIVSIGGVVIDWALDNQDGDYAAWIEAPFTQPGYTTVMAARDSTWPVGVTVSQDAFTLPPIFVRIMDAVNEDTLRVVLLRALDTSKEFKALVVADDDGGNPRFWMCSFQSREEEDDSRGTGVVYVVTAIVTGDAYLRSVNATTESWTPTASGEQVIIDNAGDLDTYPTYTVTPTSSKTGNTWTEIRPFYVRWRSPFGGEHAIDVTGSGLDTAALYTAGKVTTRSDISVYANGAYRPHWYGADDLATGGFRSTTTRLWMNFTMRPRVTVYSIHSRASDDASTTMELVMPANMPASGYIYWDATGEIMSYKGVVAGAWNPSIANVRRGEMGTAAANIAAEATGEVLQITGAICYGPGATAPDDEKMIDYGIEQYREPTITGTGSTNSVYKFDIFRRADVQVFGIPGAPLAPSGPRGSVNWSYDGGMATEAFTGATSITGTAGGFYLDQNWTGMGFKSNQVMYKIFSATGVPERPNAYTSVFSRRFAVPIQGVRVTGRRVANGAALKYPGTPLLRLFTEAADTFFQLWDAGSGGVSTTTNTAFDQLFVLMNQTVYYNRVHWMLAQSNHVQADIDTMDVTFVSEYTPVAVMTAATSPYVMNLILENVTTGESITIAMPDLTVNESLVIDSEALTATYALDNSNRYSAVRRNALRPYWLRLAPGANTLKVTETGMGNLTIGLQYETRWYT